VDDTNQSDSPSCCRYQGGRTFNDFLKFLEDQLEADKGFARSPALDALATMWMSTAPGPGQEGLITKARTQQPIVDITAAEQAARHRPAAWARLQRSAHHVAALDQDQD